MNVGHGYFNAGQLDGFESARDSTAMRGVCNEEVAMARHVPKSLPRVLRAKLYLDPLTIRRVGGLAVVLAACSIGSLVCTLVASLGCVVFFRC